MPDPTPSAPTAEMLAQAKVNEFARLVIYGSHEERVAAGNALVAALARSEPPTEGKIQAVATQRQPIVPSVLMWKAAYMAWAESAEWWDFDSEGCACNRKSAGTMAFAAWNGARAALAAPVASERDSLLPASQPSEPPTGEPVAVSDERITQLWKDEFIFPSYEELQAGAQSPVHRFSRALLAEARAPGAVPEGWKLIRDTTEAERAWPEDAKHENGTYFCRCIYCSREFTGHKRRVVCRACSIAPPIEAQAGEQSS